MRNKEILINAFNLGHLKLALVDAFAKDGYAFIFHDGKLTDIIREDV